MKRWMIFTARYSSTCYGCEQRLQRGVSVVAWHPLTKQTLHVACFEQLFHPANVKAAIRKAA